MRFLIALSLFATTSAFSAGGPRCVYVMDSAQTNFEWTAYKFTEKAPVTGTFNKVEWNAKKKKSLRQVIVSMSATFDTSSVETGNPARNKTIADGFFGKTKAPHQIKAQVKKLLGDDHGEAIVRIEFNGVKKDLKMKYAVRRGGIVEMSGTATMSDFALGGAFKSLSELCKTLHTGKDGASKTWDDFGLKLTTKIDKSCK